MSNSRRVLSIAFVVLSFLTGCGGGDATPAGPVSPLPSERPEYPFNVSELPVYSARVIVISGARTHEYFVARSHDRTRTDLHVGAPNHTSRIINGREIVISHAAKTYYEIPRGDGETAKLGDSSATVRSLFTSVENGKFEMIGMENGLTKYRVRLASGGSDGIYIFVDEKLGLVMRQEFLIAGDEKKMALSIDIRDLTLEAPDELFAIPAGYRSVNTP